MVGMEEVNAESVVLLIGTKNDYEGLKNILISVNKNKHLNHARICILDDSDRQNSIEINEKIVRDNNQGKKIVLVNKHYWDNVKKRLVSILPKKHSSQLKNLSLGKKGWNTHNTRNIGQVMCSLLYSPEDILLSLDGDMVLSKSNYLLLPKLTAPRGIVLKGCPDLSRLEWMKLYLRYLLLKEKRNIVNDNEYASVLSKGLGKKKIELLLRNYSIILSKKEKTNPLVMPTREELNNGAYFCTIGQSMKVLYPPWFDSDWFFFQRLRKIKKYKVSFLDNPIEHNSSRKDPFNEQLLIFEEEGKIITTILKEKSRGHIPSPNGVKREIERRKKLVKKEIDLAASLNTEQMRWEERTSLDTTLASLRALLRRLEKIPPHQIIVQIRDYEKSDSSWANLMNVLGKLNAPLKRDLSTPKKGELIIISPHCDDAIFSLGGAINEGRIRNVSVWDVYTKSNYSILGAKKDISKVREKEERRVLNSLGVHSLFLGYNDATKREYHSEEEYMSPNNNPLVDSSFSDVRKRIRGMVKESSADVFLFPLGIGGNIDHRVLFRIGRELEKEGYPILFYEDMGYDESDNEKKIKGQLKRERLSTHHWILEVNKPEEKLNLMREYKTQISKEIINKTERIVCKLKGERVWGRERNLSLLRE